jgi:hypothetical protein
VRRDRILTIILFLGSAVLIAIGGFLWMKADRTAPEIIFFDSELVYTQGMDESALMTSVSAYDNRDGDVTDRIVVEKIVENPAENAAVVYYAVSDTAGNVAKASRHFSAAPVPVSEPVSGRPAADFGAESGAAD